MMLSHSGTPSGMQIDWHDSSGLVSSVGPGDSSGLVSSVGPGDPGLIDMLFRSSDLDGGVD